MKMAEPGTELFGTIAEKLQLGNEEKQAAAELILLNPDLLLAQYKSSLELFSEGERYARDGNQLVAENRFASAAKLALYEGDPDNAKKYLEKSVAIDQTKNSSYKIASNHFDSVSKCVLEYYKAKYGLG